MMPKIIREMRGIPYFLLKEYLQEMGGILVNEDLVSGQGWRVQLDRMEPFRLGSLSVGQTRLTMDLEDDIAESFLVQFGKKTLRAGG
ncbi:MAG TPA: DUF1952 domain-containing protein [Anaerolineales bacterium]|nr:DUF1952 domain-containing protein [Anaerolineales bacterium]